MLYTLLPKHKGILVITSLCLALITACADQTGLSFNADLWRAQKNKLEQSNPRANMIVELEEKYIRVGMSRQQIITLLGEPDKSHKNTDLYNIGTSPMGADLEAYEISYQADIVVGFKVSRS